MSCRRKFPIRPVARNSLIDFAEFQQLRWTDWELSDERDLESILLELLPSILCDLARNFDKLVNVDIDPRRVELRGSPHRFKLTRSS